MMMMILTFVLSLAIQSSEEAVRLAKKALAARLSVGEESIEVASAESVEWRDSSLGCPEPDMMYAQVIVSGFRVSLRASNKTYPVHVGGGRAVVCEKKSSSPEALLSQKAREDLVRRLGVPAARIEVVSTTPRTWPDTSLGCPEPEHMYAQVLTEGFVITLRADGKLFSYHTDKERVVYCSKP